MNLYSPRQYATNRTASMILMLGGGYGCARVGSVYRMRTAIVPPG